jgi:hypothetical protein
MEIVPSPTRLTCPRPSDVFFTVSTKSTRRPSCSVYFFLLPTHSQTPCCAGKLLILLLRALTPSPRKTVAHRFDFQVPGQVGQEAYPHSQHHERRTNLRSLHLLLLPPSSIRSLAPRSNSHTQVLFGSGDVLAQQAVDRRGLEKHDFARTGRMALYGGGRTAIRTDHPKI